MRTSVLTSALKKKKALCECSLAALVTMLLQEPGEGRARSRGDLGGGAGQAEAGQGGRVQEEPGPRPGLHENMTNDRLKHISLNEINGFINIKYYFATMIIHDTIHKLVRSTDL